MRSISFLLVGCLTLAVLTGYGAANPDSAPAGGPPQNFVVHLTLSRSSVLPFEPVTALWFLKNESDRPQSVMLTFDADIFIRRDGWQGWSRYARPGMEFLDFAPATLEFQPGQISRAMSVVDVDQRFEPVFPSPGIYWIKATFGPFESDPQKLEVAEASPADADALADVNRLSLFRYFTAETATAYLKSRKSGATGVEAVKPADELKSFVAAHPKSLYARWAELAILLVREVEAAEAVSARAGGGVAGAERDTLQALEQELLELAPRLPPPLDADAYFEAGVVGRMRGDRAASEASFGKALQRGPGMVMASRIEMHHKRHPWPVAAVGWEPLKDYTQAVVDLEAQHYDVHGFIREHSRPGDEWLTLSMQIAEQQASGQITFDELIRRQGELLKTYVIKESKPLPPEEWQRRDAAYRAEEQAK